MRHASWLVLFLFYSTNLLSQQIQQQQLVLESIFTIEPISELLALDNTKDTGTIRVFARTKKLRKNYFLYFNKSQPTSFPLQVTVRHNDCPVDINTGYYRDLFVYKYKKKGNKIQIALYLSNYLCIYDKKNRYRFEIEVEVSNAVCVVKSIYYAEWH